MFSLTREALNTCYINSASAAGYVPYSYFPITQKYVFQEDQDVELNSLDKSYDDNVHSCSDKKDDNPNATKQETKLTDKGHHHSSFTSYKKFVFNFIPYTFAFFFVAISVIHNSVNYQSWLMDTTNSFNDYMLSCYAILIDSAELLDDPTEQTFFQVEEQDLSDASYNLSSIRFPAQYGTNNHMHHFSTTLLEDRSSNNFANEILEFSDSSV